MAQGKFTLYYPAHEDFWKGNIKFETDTIVCVLLGAGYTPSTAHSTYADVSANEIADADYSPQTVSGASVTGSGGVVTVTSNTVDFGSNVSIECKYIVYVKRSGASLAGTDTLVGYADLNTAGTSASVSSTNSEFKVSPDAQGLMTDTIQ